MNGEFTDVELRDAPDLWSLRKLLNLGPGSQVRC